MALDFEKYSQEGNLFLKKVAEALEAPDDRGLASRVTMAVFQALRDRITPNESMHLVSQLPMALKGVYVSGWNMSAPQSNAKTAEDFLDEVKSHLPRFSPDQEKDLREMVRSFFEVLKEYVDEGELNDLRAQLPKEVGELVM